MGYLALWEVFESKQRSDIEGLPDRALYFMEKIRVFSQLHSVHGAIYKPGRTFLDSLPFIYEKGGYFVWMLESVMGEDRFQRAIRSYLNKYQFGTVDHEQLWASLDEENPFDGISMSTVFNTWLMQEGYPYLTVSRCYTEKCKNQVTFKQRRYRYNNKLQSELKELWYIPISYAIITYDNDTITTTDVKNSFVMQTQELVHDLGSAPLDSNFAIIVNVNNTGMYLVGYDERNWKAIGTVLMKNPHVIPPATRMQLVTLLKNGLARKEIHESLFLCIGEYLKVRLDNKYLLDDIFLILESIVDLCITLLLITNLDYS